MGSTQCVPDRFKNHKSAANLKRSKGSGLAKHFGDGCPHDPNNDRNKPFLKIKLIDSIVTTPEELVTSGHLPGVQCRCRVCDRLKGVEDKWILRLGTFFGGGLNTRNEIKSKNRVNY